ncbi:C2 calcium-dependent domain-containing protein 4C [Electrophorus electricus]|uniref:C2 domain-containing protein n=1 Tax=Electrophorus electricus TaxID=8005 RepID=A0AAY5E7S1_ELEEL|nr:C2 calcium-dependent domain-containing protein 4C [Electrophorus electricus]XP_035383684.1 C2 calcium-dependent domain-containing protein 4C [Electrophorus electricus]XP_035383685.1 C2 calcium-dependent domain-containing protein 4C [Electrophorus electricus]XP_035383686.1 C2 calcium-dependent domain-containing protein 4C [Electrophorus electricus]XP_035383687.1 C2 calcium-dependent domain-containing protein 4C [Electrophorus electricus]XP_035383688.1 C2 calcium-dependent domain-containing p
MWLLEKIRGSVEGNVLRQGDSADKQSKTPAYSNVLTPDKIPDFFIPPKLVCCPPEAETPELKPKNGLHSSASEQAICSKTPQCSTRSPRLMCKLAGDTKNLLKAANRHIIQIESADDLAAGDAGDLTTNADPQSQTAMSLPYVPKAQTSYGFATLMESPHTRRKESLFHSDPTSPLTSPNVQRRTQGNHLNPSDCNTAHANPYRYFSGGESDTCSSAESSPFNSPLLSRSASLLRMVTHETRVKVSRARRSLARHSSLSTDECSSVETSPSVPRRRHCPPSPAFGGRKAGAGAGAERLTQHTVNLHKGGTLRLCADYDTEAARLRVRVLAAEDLYDRQVDVKSINCCVALYLNPGKQQKQRSTIIKNSRNPVFNEDFFFDSLSAAQVKTLALKMKVVNKGTSLKRDTLLGEREVPLKELLAGF